MDWDRRRARLVWAIALRVDPFDCRSRHEFGGSSRQSRLGIRGCVRRPIPVVSNIGRLSRRAAYSTRFCLARISCCCGASICKNSRARSTLSDEYGDLPDRARRSPGRPITGQCLRYPRRPDAHRIRPSANSVVRLPFERTEAMIFERTSRETWSIPIFNQMADLSTAPLQSRLVNIGVTGGGAERVGGNYRDE